MRLEISKNEIMEGDTDYQIHRLSDLYLTKIIMKANEIGLQGKKIKEIVKIEPTFIESLYIDFVCEQQPTEH